MAQKKGKNRTDGKEFKVGDAVKVKLNDRRVVDATVRAIVNDGEQKLQIDCGHEDTALIHEYQVIED